MFDQLSNKIQDTFRKLTGKAKLSEENMQDALAEIRRALLEADVNFKVVKTFIEQVKQKALGQDVLRGLDPGQQLVKIVHGGLVELLGGQAREIDFSRQKPYVIMVVGLQGTGKTTTCGKLANYLAKKGKKPLLVPCDVYRPAAILQLQTVGAGIDVPVFDSTNLNKPLEIVDRALAQAKKDQQDVLIVDTAGRLHIDDTLMDELKQLKAKLNPSEIFFVADAMTGQDAVTSAGAFHQALELSGVIMTKLDGDARGGAALSISEVTGARLRFVGLGEKVDDFEPFHPDRMAGRILGMGDVLSLVERVQERVDQEEAMALQKKMLENQFTLEDFSKTISQIGKMGDLGGLMGMMPGMGKLKEKMDINKESKQFTTFQAIINSMTPEERQNHAILTNRRKARIAKGSGRQVSEINKMLQQFMQMRQMMSLMTKPGKLGKLRQMFSRAGMGDFAKNMFPGSQYKLPNGMTEEQLEQLAEQNGGQLPPEVIQQLMPGAARPAGHQASRPKKDRKKEKAKRKQGRKRR
ncbi:MAG: signal recognition particle protein [Acidobacteria bacterium]|nr:signal recognition particle protein [Acidobacteriota bacterium]MCB9398456.1 signal recognition particle protein [Acidobacteriota bacterium]